MLAARLWRAACQPSRALLHPGARHRAAATAMAQSARIPPPVPPPPVAVPLVRVALCQVAVTADKAANIATATDAIRAAAQQGAKLVVLPEMWNCPCASHLLPLFFSRRLSSVFRRR